MSVIDVRDYLSVRLQRQQSRREFTSAAVKLVSEPSALNRPDRELTSKDLAVRLQHHL